MGDKITDLPDRVDDVPPVPLKTYQWEDIRRQKLEGRYPWTHLYKPQFDQKKQIESKEHEYEPVVPMDSVKNTSPVPTLRITAEKDICKSGATELKSPETIQDKRHLCIPDNEDSDESNEDDSDEITAEELQQRLEERYFQGSTSDSVQHDSELSQTRSASPAFSSQSHSRSDRSLSFHDRMQTRTDKLKRRLKSFKDHISNERRQGENTPRMKRKITDSKKKARPAKKNKFNFRKRNVKSREEVSESHSSGGECKMIRSPKTARSRRFSLPRLPSFSRSRSSSVKEGGEHSRGSKNSETDARKFFSYPRMFNSCKGKKKFAEKEAETMVDRGAAKAKSAPPTPSAQRPSPFPRRWVSRFIVHNNKKEVTPPLNRTTTKKEAKQTVASESIFISLHEDPLATSLMTETETATEKIEREPTEIHDSNARPPEIDNKNYIFISLHEERFPEKLKQLGEEELKKEMIEEEREIERELHQARTARKFHIMLKQMQNECHRMRTRTSQAVDDEPEPVIITEVIDDGVDQSNPNLLYDIEQPNEDRRGEGKWENDSIEKDSISNRRTVHKRSTISDDSLEIETERDDAAAIAAAVESWTSKPQKTPRKKLKNNLHSATGESKESLSPLEDTVFIETVTLDDRQRRESPEETSTKTYIKADLEKVISQVEPDHTIRHFKDYEKALEKSRSQTSFEVESNYYSNTNSLARLETPVPPARPSRMYTLAKRKNKEAFSQIEQKENYYDLDANATYNTFPIAKPNKPRRKFRGKITYSNSTTTTEMKSMDELEDATINNNILTAKQLSVSFLPLSTNVVGEPIVDYNLRETSSMIHLNLSPDPPLAPKRKKSCLPNSTDARFNSLPNQRFSSGGSSTPSDPGNNFSFSAIDSEIEFVDGISNVAPQYSIPRRPYRRRNNSLPNSGATWREMEPPPSSAKLSRNSNTSFENAELRNANEYAVIETPQSHTERKADSSMSMSRRISRRVSDFFTLPRLPTPTNYVPQFSQTLDLRRFPSPSRPPRRNRPLNLEHKYTNGETMSINNFNEDEGQLNFDLATEEETQERDGNFKEDFKKLETHDVFERMKSRPLPPPPRPTRKPKDDGKGDYSQCVKKKPNKHNDSGKNNLDQILTRKVVENECNPYETTSMWNSWERRTTVREFEVSPDGERREISIPISQSERGDTLIADNDVDCTDDSTGISIGTATRINGNDELVRRDTTDFTAPKSPSNEVCSSTKQNEISGDPVCIITAAKLNVSELNVGRMNVSEIDSSKLVTSNLESSSIQVNDVRTETGHVIVNSVNYMECMSAPEQCHLPDVTACRETTPMSNEDIESAETTSVRSRISSMVPEIGSDEECSNVGIRIRRPSRRKRLVQKREEVQITHIRPPAERNHATLAELMSQILGICYSSVGEALNALFDSVIPEDREKRNEVQAAIWVITIIVAGCLMLGLQSNEKVVHHHHWDFHFPPPH